MPVPPSEARYPLTSSGRLSARETASYTKDLLAGLRSIALGQRHHRLAELLDAAAAEAERLIQDPAAPAPSRK